MESVLPRVGPYDQPPSGTISHSLGSRPLAPSVNVDLEEVGVHRSLDLDDVVSPVEAQSLVDRSARPNEVCIGRGLHELAIVRIRRCNEDSQRDPFSIGEQGAFNAELSPTGGVGPGPLSSERGFGHRTVHRLPCPAQASLGVVLEESRGPETLKDPGPPPLLEARMDGARGSEVAREGTPLTAGPGEVEDPIHSAAVVDAGTTAARTGSMNGEEWGDPKPQHIGERERQRDRAG
jgi:hypothetical protein